MNIFLCSFEILIVILTYKVKIEKIKIEIIVTRLFKEKK